jgi:enterochelin esterase family protein
MSAEDSTRRVLAQPAARVGGVCALALAVACGAPSGGGGDAGASVDSGVRDDGGALADASSSTGEGDFTISAPYVPAPEVTRDPEAPTGMVYELTLSSTESTIYPTDFATHEPFDRAVAVYVPQQYVAGTAAPFIVVQDGISFYQSTMIPVLDNMIHQRRLPVMIAIFVEPGPNEDTPAGERSFEYDSVSDAYVRFVETELLPRIALDYGVTFTTDPEGRAAMGGSSGGAAAFTMGWSRPDLYRRVLTYSGSFCNLQPSAAHPLGAWEYHESLIAAGPVLPLRIALEVGENDLNWNTDTDMHRDWQDANRRMAAALAARGYHYRFVYALGADHIDSGVLAQTLPDTLAWLWEGYPIP